jgi:X-X-X-Leu-X-X-Gly heptad repeat protein
MCRLSWREAIRELTDGASAAASGVEKLNIVYVHA